ncbi:MAG TPA: helix-turn-helix domain-containing protein [Candidatus Binataceae bacterium]|nr:helix-turn-helix domain-containing protein [Candidatus Binataceae bacterium]
MKSEYVSIREAADRARIAPKTIYNWISKGRLTVEQGLARAGGRRLINWPLFEEKVLKA